jgi:hypothetical protein
MFALVLLVGRLDAGRLSRIVVVLSNGALLLTT